MFRSAYDWSVMNRGRFGEMSFSFSVTFLWVMAVIMVGNVLYLSGVIHGSAGLYSSVSVLPWPLADMFPQLTADVGVGEIFMVFLGVCVFAPFVEESFRAAILQTFCEDKETGKMKNFFVILSMSVFFFGMLHGGYFNIFIQGVLGLSLARLWFRVGRSQRWQYLSMVAVHAAYNFAILCGNLMILRSTS